MFKGFKKRFTTHRHTGKSSRRVPGLNSGCDVISVGREPPDRGTPKTTSPRQIHPSQQYKHCTLSHSTTTSDAALILDSNSNSEVPPTLVYKSQPTSPVGFLSNGKGYPTTPNLILKKGKVEILEQDQVGANVQRSEFEYQRNIRNRLPVENTFKRQISDTSEDCTKSKCEDVVTDDNKTLSLIESTTSQRSDEKELLDLPNDCDDSKCLQETLRVNCHDSNKTHKMKQNNSVDRHHMSGSENTFYDSLDSAHQEDSLNSSPVKNRHAVKQLNSPARKQIRTKLTPNRAHMECQSSSCSADTDESEEDNSKKQNLVKQKKREKGRQHKNGVIRWRADKTNHRTPSRDVFSSPPPRTPDSKAVTELTKLFDQRVIRSPEYYEKYALFMENMKLNIDKEDQNRKLFKMTEMNQELQADFKALHEAFNCSLDAIMGPLMAGIINKEQLRTTVSELKKQLAEVSDKNCQLTGSFHQYRYSSLPLSRAVKPVPPVNKCVRPPGNTGSLPHPQHNYQSPPQDKCSSRNEEFCNGTKEPNLEYCSTGDKFLDGNKCSSPKNDKMCTNLLENFNLSCGSFNVTRTLSTPEILLLNCCKSSSPSPRCKVTGRDEGYWTMSSNGSPNSCNSRSTLPRISHKNCITKSFNLKVPESKERIPSDSDESSNLGNFSNCAASRQLSLPTSTQSSKLFTNGCCKSSTVPRFSNQNMSSHERNLIQPSKTHHSICLSGSKYLSPLACDGLIRIMSDMVREIYVNVLPGLSVTKESTSKSRIPITLCFVNSPEEALKGQARGVYNLHFEACFSRECSVCSDMLTLGTSIFEVFWPCPEGRRLQLIQMVRKNKEQDRDSTIDHSSSSQTTNSVVTQVLNASQMVKSQSVNSIPTSSAKSNWCDRPDSEATSVSVQNEGLEPEFDQPELEWYGGSFQNPDNDWLQVNEFIVPSRDSPRSGCSDQLALFPNESLCGSYVSNSTDNMNHSQHFDGDCSGSLKGNLSFNSSRFSDIDNLTDRMSDKLFYMSSCPDLTSEGGSDMLMPEGDMTSLESCSEGDLMSIDRFMTGGSREYYSIVNVDVDMFSPTQNSQSGGPLLPLLSLCQPPPFSSRNSSCSPPPAEAHSSSLATTSCLPPICNQFPDPPFNQDSFPDPPPEAESSPPTPAPPPPRHIEVVDSPNIPKRITSRPLPSLPPGVEEGDADEYSIAERGVSPPCSPPPPVLPTRRRFPGSSTSTNIKQTPKVSLGTTASTLSHPMGPLHPYRVLPPRHTSLSPCEVSPLPHIMRQPPPPPRAPKRSSSLFVSHSRPVSTIDYQGLEHHYRNGSTDTSPLEGIESSWVKLNAHQMNSPASANSSPTSSNGDPSSSLPHSTNSKKWSKKNKKGRNQGNCITS